MAKAAQILAKIHNVTENFDVNINKKRNIFTEVERFLKIEKNIIQKIEQGEEFLKEVEHYTNWAKRNITNNVIIHNDYRPANVLFKGSEVEAVIDFD
ncbi:MAG: phosphotransferase [Patescibacteria group bacterium]|nr:phosphotransferase [Patescibacteria group bacterium]